MVRLSVPKFNCCSSVCQSTSGYLLPALSQLTSFSINLTHKSSPKSGPSPASFFLAESMFLTVRNFAFCDVSKCQLWCTVKVGQPHYAGMRVLLPAALNPTAGKQMLHMTLMPWELGIHGIDSTHLTAVTAVGVAAGTQQEFRRRTLSGPIYFLVFWLSITAYALALLTLICAEDLVDIQNPQTQESNRRIHRWPIVTFFISLFFIRVSSLYEPPVVMTSMYNWGF